MKKLSTFNHGRSNSYGPRGRNGRVIDWDICGMSGTDPVSDPKKKCDSDGCITLVNEGREFCRSCEKKKNKPAADLYNFRISAKGQMLGERRPKMKAYKISRMKFVLVGDELQLVKCYLLVKRWFCG
jgi:hypothetical protein